MKKLLLIFAFMSFSLPAFCLETNIDLTCTFVPEGTNEAFTIGPLYLGEDKKVYDPDNVAVGEIFETKNGDNSVTAKLYDGDWLNFFINTSFAEYKYKNGQIYSWGSCKIKKYNK